MILEIGEEEDPLIINQGYMKPPVVKEGVQLINLRCSGTLGLKKDDPLLRPAFVQDPAQDATPSKYH